MNSPGDRYEREAEQVADRVMRMPLPGTASTLAASPVIQRMCTHCAEEQQANNDETDESPVMRMPLASGAAAVALPLVQRMCSGCQREDEHAADNRSGATLVQRRADAAGGVNTAAAGSAIASLGGGQPLPPVDRAYFEPRFGRDFGDVRLHTGAASAEAARSLSARAFTTGRNIVVGSGEYTPGSDPGRRLLAHELVHTIQQGDSSGTPDVQRLGDLSKVPAGLACPVPNASSPFTTIVDVEFPLGSAVLTPAQRGRIDDFVDSWRALGANQTVRVDGFASTDGADELNWRLSCDRAVAVAGELSAPLSGGAGVPGAFLEMFADGETNEFSATRLEPNRRVTIGVPTPPPPVTCPNAASPQTRATACVQPVRIAEDDGSAPTTLPGSGDIVSIWGRCCIDVTVNAPVTVNGTRFKEIEDAGSGAAPTSEEQDMFDAVGASGTCVEVFIVDTIRRGVSVSKTVAGGATTKNTGTTDPKIIAVEGVVSSVIAHELGHAFGQGHGLGIRADGVRTVMQPTGSPTVASSPNVSTAICSGARGNTNVAAGAGSATCCEDVS